MPQTLTPHYGAQQRRHAWATEQAIPVLERVLDAPLHQVRESSRVDLIFRAASHSFIAEVKSNARAGSVAMGIQQLRSYGSDHPDAIPLLIVPAMGPIGEKLCAEANISWLDLHGNANIRHDGLRILIRGQHAADLNEIDAGLNPFGVRASRVVHALLSNPAHKWTRTQLAKASGLDKGFVSKIVAALLDQGYIIEEPTKSRSRSIATPKPLVLLDAWSEHYKPAPPAAYGLLGSHDSIDSVHKIQDLFEEASQAVAFTSLPAAFAYTHFSGFRQIDAYVSGPLPDRLRRSLHVEPDSRGRNVVFRIDQWNVEQSTIVDGIRCVSPVVAYLDLAEAPERSKEARAELRRYLENRWV